MKTRLELRLDFLQIICAHEHYVQLNLPYEAPTPSEEQVELCDAFRERHYLSGLLLTQFALLLDYRDKAIRRRAVRIMRNLLARLDGDERYQDSAKCVAHGAVPGRTHTGRMQG